jgi:hypothetical protein
MELFPLPFEKVLNRPFYDFINFPIKKPLLFKERLFQKQKSRGLSGPAAPVRQSVSLRQSGGPRRYDYYDYSYGYRFDQGKNLFHDPRFS